MIDLPLMEQFDRLLWAVLVGLALVPLWRLTTLLGRRRGVWRALAEALGLTLLSLAACAALFIGTSGDLRGYSFLGLMIGVLTSSALLGVLGVPWQESQRRRRSSLSP